MTDFSQLRTTRLGKLGESIVKELMEKQGYISYAPTEDKAHPFDTLYATPDKKNIFIVEVKTKPERVLHSDTGINESHFRDYRNIAEKYNLDVYLLFVDHDRKAIYGNLLSELWIGRDVWDEKAKRKQHYPWAQKSTSDGKTIIYYPTCAMKQFGTITIEQEQALEALSSRRIDYTELAKSFPVGEEY